MDTSVYHEVKAKLSQKNVTLVVVSKNQPLENILPLYGLGQRIFGENRVQNLLERYEALPKDIEWHLIGHLQSNKVKYIASFVSLIHSIDSLKVLAEVNRQAQINHRVIDCLLQVHIAQEETKFGLSTDELIDLLASNEFKEMKGVRICGLMGMASLTDNKDQIKSEFQTLSWLFRQIKEQYFNKQLYFNQLSMGMSSDYGLAVNEGSTMVRIGSLLFS